MAQHVGEVVDPGRQALALQLTGRPLGMAAQQDESPAHVARYRRPIWALSWTVSVGRCSVGRAVHCVARVELARRRQPPRSLADGSGLRAVAIFGEGLRESRSDGALAPELRFRVIRPGDANI